MLQKFREYQNQIWASIRRFPVVVGFALYTTIAFIVTYLLEYRAELWQEPLGLFGKVFCWLWLYPIPALLIAYAFTLRNEVAQKRNLRPHLIAQIAWFFISFLNAIFLKSPINESLFTIEFFILASPFILPFWEKANDLNIWKFIGANIKAATIAILTTGILNGAVAFLFFALNTLFDIDISDDAFVISAIICWAAVFPVLFLAGIPELAGDSANVCCIGITGTAYASNNECANTINCAGSGAFDNRAGNKTFDNRAGNGTASENQGSANLNRSKFVMNAVHFLFIPIHLLYIGFLYAYGIKIILFYAEYGMVSLFATIAMVSMLIVTTILYPSHFDDARKMDRKILVALPLLNIPLVIFMAVDFFHLLATNDLEPFTIYSIHLSAWFFAAIALCSLCVKKKIRWILISFGIAIAISTIGPLNANRIAYNLTTGRLTEILNEKGFTKFPLSCEQYTQFIKSLSHEYDTTTGGRSEMVRFMNAMHEVRSIGGEAVLAQFFERENCGEFETETDENDEEISPEINYAVSNLITAPYAIPQKRSRAFPLDQVVEEPDFEIKDSVLSFKLKPFPDDSASVFAFAVPLDTLKERDNNEDAKIPLIFESEKSTLVIRKFDFNYSHYRKQWHVDGVLYLQ